MKFLRFLLFPFSITYDIVTSLRNLMFDIGFFKETSFKIPTITVHSFVTKPGNLLKSPVFVAAVTVFSYFSMIRLGRGWTLRKFVLPGL